MPNRRDCPGARASKGMRRSAPFRLRHLVSAGGTWNIQGRAGQVSVGSIDASWRASFTEPLSSLVTTGDLGGQVATPSLGVLQAGGDLRNARIMVGADFGADGLLVLNNSGTLKKTAGNGDFGFEDTTLNNTGTITVLIGRILVNGVPL